MSVPRLVSALASNPDLNPWLLVCPYATSYPKGALTAGDSTVGVLSAKATTVESLTDTGDASVGGKLTVTGKGGMLAARSRLLKRDKQKHGDGFIWPI